MTVMLDLPAPHRSTRPAERPAQPIAPCRRDPVRWTAEGEDPELVRMCRQECPRRFACAADALATRAVEGIWAGVYVPTTSQRARAHALRRLDALATLGRLQGRER